jgi:muconate cycloisomerase
MKITRIETIPVCVPLKKGMTTKTAHGEHVTSPYVIVRVHTDEGITGIGEATVSQLWSGENQSTTLAVLKELIEPALLGKDPRNITEIRRKMDSVLKLHPFTKAAVEMAMWDISGKAVNLPVYQLLGGKARDKVRIKLVVWARDIAGSRAMAEQHLALGVTCVKVKTGIDPVSDVARVRAVREVCGPDIPLTIDSNCGWTLQQAKYCLRELADVKLLLAEQPIPPGDHVAMAELRHETTTPIMADESIFTLQDAWLLSTHRAVDIFSIYPGKHGGISATADIVAIARAAGLRCTIGSNLELGIGTAAMLHVAAAFPEVDTDAFPADTIGPFYHEADLITTPLNLGPPAAFIPDGPGLGVELDEDQLKHWRVD